MNGKIGEIKNRLPTESDLSLHLSTIFTENRLKKYIELRSMDTCGWDCLCAGPAFFIGLLYGNLEEVYILISSIFPFIKSLKLYFCPDIYFSFC